jgi:hypothetical protein
MPQTEPMKEARIRVADAAWPLRDRIGPFACVPGRLRLIWFGLALVALLPMMTAPSGQWHDFSAFWDAGGTVGSSALTDSHLHQAWQVAHGVPVDGWWRYPPAFAYLYWPASLLPMGVGFVLSTILMFAIVGVSGILLARIFSLSGDFALRLTFAWTPMLAALNMGQNTPLSCVLALWAIDALRRDRSIEAGSAIGLMMYKPTLALPLLGFLLLRRRWRAAFVVIVAMGVWYLLSVPASGGDWLWPAAWLNGLQSTAPGEFATNADKAVSIPGLLVRIPGLPAWLPYAAGGVLVLASLRGLVRAPLLEAASVACLIGLAAGPRVWSYEAGLMLPFLAWVASGGLAEPWRTRVVLLATGIGITWMISPVTQVSGVAIFVDVAAVLWIWRWRPWSSGPNTVPATD